ncbi:MAG: glutamate--tRNA ligase [Phycisphaerales bacterium]
MSSTPPVITRFAPSPTGHLHVGGARTALFCWAFAKKNHGHFLLRIEDTDAARSSDESARGIMEDLAWLSINWDEGPELKTKHGTIGGDPRTVGSFFQARRVKTHYDPHIMMLVEQGKAYPAFETNEETEAERKKAVAAKQTYRYNRASYEKVKDIKERIRLIEKGEPHVIRFFAPHEEIIVYDQVLGDVRSGPGEVDDFVIRKQDGFPTYHFAVVVDDHSMGITHVLRAQEHLINTPRHVALQRAFGFKSPIYGHMPLIMNMDNSKMSKRDKAKVARKTLKDALAKSNTTITPDFAKQLSVDTAELTAFLNADNDNLVIAEAIAKHYSIGLPEIEVADFREAGYTPEAINNFLALLGWNPGMKLPDGKDLEKFDMDFLSKNFSIERIGKTNSKFDRVKLMSFNADALGAMSDEEFAKRWFAWCEEFAPALAQKAKQWGGSGGGSPATSARWLWLAKAVKPRAKTLKDAIKACGFLMLDHVTIDPAVAAKHLDANNAEGRSLLKTYCERLSSLAAFEPKPIHDEIEKLAKEKGFANPGLIAQAVRVAVAGVPVTPGIGETLAVLGKEEALKRLLACAS